jgi:hypothetical protein
VDGAVMSQTLSYCLCSNEGDPRGGGSHQCMSLREKGLFCLESVEGRLSSPRKWRQKGTNLSLQEMVSTRRGWTSF